jgi:acylaminoacyl-peptidase
MNADSLHTAATAGGTRRFAPADVFRLRHAIEPQISADGRHLCFVRIARDIATDSRRATLMLSNDRRTWREIDPRGRVEHPRFSPDGTRLAFLRTGKDGHEIVVLDTGTGESRTLHSAAVTMRELAWSPDGTRLAWQQMEHAQPPAWLDLPQPPDGAAWGPPPRLTERRLYRHDVQGELPEGAFQVFVADANGPAPRQITAGPWSSGFVHGPGLVWSRDGQALVLAASRRADWDVAPMEMDLHAVDVGTGTVTQLTQRPGANAMPAIAADGRIAFTGVARTGVSAASRRAYVLPPGGGEPVDALPGLDRSIDALAWAGDTLFVSYDDEGGKVIARCEPGGGVRPLVRDVGGGNIEMPYSSGSFSVAQTGTVLYTRAISDVPCELALVEPDGATATLTDLNGALLREVGGFVRAAAFWTRSRNDGLRIQSWLLRPRDAAPDAKLPLILEIHGGPFACYGDRFSIKHQCFAAAGYAVLLVNPRGSIGYGEAFAQALHDRHPGPDWDDLMDALDAAIAGGGIDAGRLYVTGTSGGGVLTLWSVTHSDRFRAAVSLKPVVNQESWALTADIGLYLGDLWFGGVKPWENLAKYRDRSPLSFVERVTTPTMLIGGDADTRTPISEAQQMYAALQWRGVTTALVSIPEARHGTASMRPSAFAAEIAYTLSWFRRFA